MTAEMVRDTAVQPVWVPGRAALSESAVARFAAWCVEQRHLPTSDFATLREWSVADIAAFWTAVWDYFSIESSAPYAEVVTSGPMPETRWFVGAHLNYVDHVLRDRPADEVAIVDAREPQVAAGSSSLTWAELDRQVFALRRSLAEAGVGEGDTVAGYMPNCPQTVVAFLAAASLGAVWSVCGQDYSAAAATARLAQLGPKVLVTATGYVFGGKIADRTAELGELAAT